MDFDPTINTACLFWLVIDRINGVTLYFKLRTGSRLAGHQHSHRGHTVLRKLHVAFCRKILLMLGALVESIFLVNDFCVVSCYRLTKTIRLGQRIFETLKRNRQTTSNAQTIYFE